MFGGLIENLSDYFSGDNINFCGDGDSILDVLNHSGVDLSMYSSDEIKEALVASWDTDEANVDGNNCGQEITFGASPDVDARNLAKSSLETKLSSHRIYTNTLYTDKFWGGLDAYSGSKVYDAINTARDNNKISDSVFIELMSLLKKACHTQ